MSTHPPATHRAASAESAYALWLETIPTKDVASVVALYEEDGALWGTLASEPKLGRGAIQTYFDWFLNRQDIAVSTLDVNHRQITGDVSVAHGSYRFELDGVVTDARFTFVFRRDEQTNEWGIVEHHSSLFPPKAS